VRRGNRKTEKERGAHGGRDVNVRASESRRKREKKKKNGSKQCRTFGDV